MGVTAVRADGLAVRLAGFPVDVFSRDPLLLDVHRVEFMGQPEALVGDFVARKGGRGEGGGQ